MPKKKPKNFFETFRTIPKFPKLLCKTQILVGVSTQLDHCKRGVVPPKLTLCCQQQEEKIQQTTHNPVSCRIAPPLASAEFSLPNSFSLSLHNSLSCETRCGSRGPWWQIKETALKHVLAKVTSRWWTRMSPVWCDFSEFFCCCFWLIVDIVRRLYCSFDGTYCFQSPR